MTTQTNYFATLNAIHVSEHIERKGGFGYLSWPYAVAQLRLADPAATWEVRRFDGKPYLMTELGFFVEVAVTVRGITLTQIHPVLDGRNRPLAAPTAFDINSSLQRCLVKAIALHGIGLYIYAGEDLPAGVAEAANDETPLAPISTTTPKTTRKKTAAPLATKAPAIDPPDPSASSNGLVTLEQCQRIEELLIEVGGDRDRLLAYFGVETLAQIRVVDYPRVIRSLENRRAA